MIIQFVIIQFVIVVFSDHTYLLFFLCFNATQVLRILIGITLFFAHAQLQTSVSKL